MPKFARLQISDRLNKGSDDTRPDRVKTRITIDVEVDSPHTLEMYMGGLRVLNGLFSAQLESLSEDSLAQIVRICTPTTPVPSVLFKQAMMTAKAKSAILLSGDWVTAAEVSRLTSIDRGVGGAEPREWQQNGRIFSLCHEGVDYFPLYALDAMNGYLPLSALENVLKVLATQKDGWGMAYWFASANSGLGGKAPKELLRSAPVRVLAAAEDEVAGMTHS